VTATAPRLIAEMVGGRFQSAVATPQSLTVVNDNVPNPTIPSTGRWCRLAVQLGQRQQIGTSGTARKMRTTGVALAQLFEPIGGGDGLQLDLVGAIQAAFDKITLPGPPVVAFQPPYVSAPAAREDSWWSTVVTIPFRADETV
jgi:hypothetical protein